MVLNRRAKRAAFPVANAGYGQTLIRMYRKLQFLLITFQFMTNIKRQRDGVALASDLNGSLVSIEGQRRMRLKEHPPTVVEPQINLIVVDRYMNEEFFRRKDVMGREAKAILAYGELHGGLLIHSEGLCPA